MKETIYNKRAFNDEFQRDLALGGTLWEEVREEGGWSWNRSVVDPPE